VRVSALSTVTSILTSLLECYQLEENWSHFTRLIDATNIWAMLSFYTTPNHKQAGLSA